MRVRPVLGPQPRPRYSAPQFRLHVYRGPNAEDMVAFDFFETNLSSVLESARVLSEEDRSLWALAVVTDPMGHGLTWVSGIEYHLCPQTSAERELRAEMQDRYLSARTLRGEPPMLPEGLRVIRMSPEWTGGLSLWETFGERCSFEPGDLPIPRALEQELIDWNREWEGFALDGPTPPSWIERGWALHARLQQALAGFAEVRPDFESAPEFEGYWQDPPVSDQSELRPAGAPTCRSSDLPQLRPAEPRTRRNV